jgi:hypothetical protein
MLSSPAHAQEGPEIGIRGRITGPDGAGVPHVLIRAHANGQVLEARTDDNGNYRLTGASAGSWLVTMRRIGFAADSSRVQLGDGLDIYSRQLHPLVAFLGEQRITDSWLGVHGVVGDRDYQPLSDATVEIVGRQDEARTTVDGQFALPQMAGASVLLRVRAPGFDPRLVSALIPESGAVELSVLLDRSGETAANDVIADELDRRMNWASPQAVYLTRAEILETEALDLRVAMNLARSSQLGGVRVGDVACVFVDGVARPGMPLGAVRPENVEFIEVYGSGTERTGQLGRRWPPRGECGTSDAGSARNLRRASNAPPARLFVVVWTRKS